VAHVQRGEHPLELGPPDATIQRVVNEILIVVEVNELIRQDWKKTTNGQYGDNCRRAPFTIPVFPASTPRRFRNPSIVVRCVPSLKS
jgi:hypothetical protein